MPRHLILGAMALLGCTLACNAGSDPGDARATVESVYSTLTLASPAGVTSTATAGPTTSPLPPTPSITPTPPRSRAADGGIVPIGRCRDEVSVDGQDLDDWDTADTQYLLIGEPVFGNTRWTGEADASGGVYLCWTEDAIYLLVFVTDEAHVQTQQGENAFRGDEVELFLDTDLRGDFYAAEWSRDDIQIGLSPGNFAELPPSAVLYHPERDTEPDIAVAAFRPIGAGGNYSLEAALPWETLGMVPSADLTYGLCVAISDNDQPGQASQDTLVSTCEGQRVVDPTTWGISVQFAP